MTWIPLRDHPIKLEWYTPIHTRLGMAPAQGWRAQSREVYQVFFLQPFLPLGAFEFFWCLHLFIDLFDVQLHWLWSDGLNCRYFHLARAHWREFRPGFTQTASRKESSSVIWRVPTTWRTGQTHQTTNRTRTFKQPCFAWFPCLILYNFVLYCIGRSKQFVKSDSPVPPRFLSIRWNPQRKRWPLANR